MGQRIEYTITFRERHWWGGHKRRVLEGTGSSKKENELLIFREGEGFESINYDHVLWVEARAVAHDHAPAGG